MNVEKHILLSNKEVILASNAIVHIVSQEIRKGICMSYL